MLGLGEGALKAVTAMTATPVAATAVYSADVDERGDEFLTALEALEETLRENEVRTELMRARMADIRRRRAEGASYREIVPAELRPLVVQLLTESAQALDVVGAEVRRSEAAMLYRDGLTMDEIARRFGVTRQRVSALLREARTAAHA